MVLIAPRELLPVLIQQSADAATELLTFANTEALRALASAPVLLHGDFKASNLHWLSSGELLVLDWEFAYAGPSLMDVGQLLRWSPGPEFVAAFAGAYRESAPLPEGFERWGAAFDLFNLVGLLDGVEPETRRAIDVRGRILRTTGGSAA